MTEKVKCAVVGLGMGVGHALGYVGNDRAELVGVADLDPGRFGRVKEVAPDVACFTDFQQMLEQTAPDVVSVALPNFLHEPVSVAALEAGAHVMCEKPLAHTLESALRIQHAAAASGKQVFMNLSQRFSEKNMQARALFEAGAFGEMYHGYTEWTRRDWMPGFGGWFGQKEKSGGGPLIDLGVHKIDLALWLMGRPKPLTVSGTTHYQRGVPLAKKQGAAFDVEDFACGFIRFENGASLVFEISWAGYQQGHSQESMRLIGTHGGLETVRGADGLDYIYNHEVNGVPISGRIIPDGRGRASTNVLVDALLDDTPFPANLEDGLRMQVILEALYRSAERGAEINVKDEFPKAYGLL